jgi:hypothetical protein
MTYHYSTNTLPSAGSVAIYSVMTTLVAAGWTVKSTGDGTTYTSSGNGITGGGTGAGGLGNNNAWFRIQAPVVGSQKRELCFQRTTTNLLWRVKYSASANFTGGSPSATIVPSATDEVVIFGSGTNASPTGATQFGTDGQYRFSVVAGDSTVGYSFYWAGSNSTTTTVTTGFLMDVMTIGSYSSGDTDPCVIYDGYGTGVFTAISSSPGIGGYTNTFGLLGTTYLGISTSIIGLSSNAYTGVLYFLAPALAGTNALPNPFTGNDDLLPTFWGRFVSSSTSQGYKGTSSMLLSPTTRRSSLDTFTVSTAKDHILFGHYVLPWDGSTPLT